MSSIPSSLRRARLDNLALIPGNLLVAKSKWQQLANRLPKRAILIVVPPGRSVQKDTMLRVAKLLAKEGHQVRVVSADEVIV